MRAKTKKTVAISETEKALQIRVVWFLKTYYPNALYLAIRNEGKRSLREGKEAKDMGLRPGASDLLILNKSNALFLELKTAKGRQSDTQKTFAKLVAENQSTYTICRSYAEAILQIHDFLK